MCLDFDVPQRVKLLIAKLYSLATSISHFPDVFFISWVSVLADIYAPYFEVQQCTSDMHDM